MLLFIDNIFRFTQAGSEVSALLGRIPSAVGYQPTLATEMGKLQERITDETVSQARRGIWPQVILGAGGEYGTRDYLSGTSLRDGRFWNWNATPKVNMTSRATSSTSSARGSMSYPISARRVVCVYPGSAGGLGAGSGVVVGGAL